MSSRHRRRGVATLFAAATLVLAPGAAGSGQAHPAVRSAAGPAVASATRSVSACDVPAQVLDLSAPVVSMWMAPPPPPGATMRTVLPGPVTAATEISAASRAILQGPWSTLVVSRGRLHKLHALTDAVTGEQHAVSRWVIGGKGWGPMRVIALAPGSLFALHRDGTLHRYRFADAKGYGPGPIRNDGALPGFRGVLGLTVASASNTHVTFLANTTSGRLQTITVPLRGRMTARTTVVRRSGWARADQLVAAPCGRGYGLLAVDASTNTARLYDLGVLRGTRTGIVARGRVPGTWEGGPVSRFIEEPA